MSSIVLNVYKQYIEKYHDDPATEQQLIAYSKSIGNPIKFKDAKKFMFDLVSGNITLSDDENKKPSKQKTDNIVSNKASKTVNIKKKFLPPKPSKPIKDDLVKKLKNEINKLKMNIEELTKENNKLKEDLKDKNMELTQKDVKINELNDEISELQTELKTQKRDKNAQKVINRTPKPLKKAKKLRKKKSSLFIPPSPTQYISKFPPPSPPPMSATLDKNNNNNNIPPLMHTQSLPPAMMRPPMNHPMNQMNALNMMKAQSQSQKILNHQPILNNNYNPRQAFINQYQMGGANQSMPSINNNNNNTGPPQMMNYNQQRQMWNNQYQYQQYLNKQMTNNNNINNNGNKQINPKGINK